MSVAVFYFGGFLASQPDIDKWLRSARLQKPHIIFRGFPWPSGASAKGAAAIKTLTDDGRLAAMVKTIEQFEQDQNSKKDKDGNTDPVETIFLVGHSSGGAIANAVDAAVGVDAHIVLVILDGSMPSDSQLSRTDTQVWGAMCDGVTSLNFPGSAKGRRKVFHATNCKTTWALHFSIVNANANDSMFDPKGDFSVNIPKGYTNCAANLGFLGRSMELP
jgi:hypothetical protein